MSSKLEREEEAIRKAEQELRDRKKKLQQKRREEEEKQLSKAVGKIGIERAILILEKAAEISPDKVISMLEKPDNEHQLLTA
ncbi:hypothetical protein D6851_15880 [Altericroceibacterium spongiae]|uniref:Uncharacterized protein n=1 Tax=Altericroceibacterium spongiae TaxID=2320269 RepID=A0A420EAL3_9SPHN|nr:hypothetical protein [Altericroceibacterium spongiae]RKF17736.1 hypothetical protein D6851_15880 [Altericroceibacterium spongiae]